MSKMHKVRATRDGVTLEGYMLAREGASGVLYDGPDDDRNEAVAFLYNTGGWEIERVVDIDIPTKPGSLVELSNGLYVTLRLLRRESEWEVIDSNGKPQSYGVAWQDSDVKQAADRKPDKFRVLYNSEEN